MADLEITADVTSVVQAEKSLNQMQNQLERLFKKYKRGAVDQSSFKKGLLELKRAYADLGVSNQKASGQIEKYVRSVEKATAAQKKAADQKEWLQAQRRRIQMMEQSAKMEARAAREAAQNAQRQARAVENLKEKYLPLYAASKRYERALDEINKAHKEGVLSTAQYETAIENLNTQYNQLNVRSQGNIRGFNNMGMAMQQTGYQVGDFLVQIQSGTNAMVAFGQQATQLVGILPMFAESLNMSATRLIAISAGLGIVIPLVTALGGAWMRTRKDTNEATSAFDSLSSAIGSTSSAIEIHKMSVVELTDKYGALGLEARKASVAIAQADYRNSVRAIRDEAVPALDELAEAFNLKNSVEMFSFEWNEAMEDISEMSDRMKINSLQARNLFETFDRFKNANTLEQQVVAATALRSAMSEIPEEVLKTDAELNNAVKAINRLFLEGTELNKLMTDLKESSSEFKTVIESVNMSGIAAAAGLLASNMGVAADEAVRYNRALNDAAGIQNTTSGPRLGFGLPGMNAEEEAGVGFARLGFGDLDKPPVRRKVGYTKPTGGSSGGGSSSGSGGAGSRIGSGVFSFMQQFMDEEEKIDAWRDQQLEKLQSFNEQELELLRQHGINKASIEEEYKNRIEQIKEQERSVRVNEMTGMFSALAAVAETGGKKMLKIQATLSGAATMIAAYETAQKAAAEATTIPGRIKAYAMFVAKGIQTVQSINAIGSSGSASAGGGAGGAIATPAAQQASPQRVIVEGLRPGDMISGEMLQDLFDRLYEENQERGLVFQIST